MRRSTIAHVLILFVGPFKTAGSDVFGCLEAKRWRRCVRAHPYIHNHAIYKLHEHIYSDDINRILLATIGDGTAEAELRLLCAARNSYKVSAAQQPKRSYLKKRSARTVVFAAAEYASIRPSRQPHSFTAKEKKLKYIL